jgi:ribonuclease-3
MGHEAARIFIEKRFAAAMDHLTRDDFEDKKSLLQELTQREIGRSVTYKLLKMDGPDHAPHFESGAYCNGLLLGQGQGSNKKESEQAAAAAALASKGKWLKTLLRK